MRITDGQRGIFLELRGKDDSGLTREGWGSFPLALAIPLLGALLLPFPQLERLLSTEFLQIWIPLLALATGFEMVRFIKVRRLTRLAFDGRSGILEIETRSAWGSTLTFLIILTLNQSDKKPLEFKA